MKYYFLIPLILWINLTGAQTLTSREIIQRCYQLLTNRPMPTNHSLLSQNFSNSADACLEILAFGNLDENGYLERRLQNQYHQEAKWVLRQVLNIHLAGEDHDFFQRNLGAWTADLKGLNYEGLATHQVRILLTPNANIRELVQNKVLYQIEREPLPHQVELTNQFTFIGPPKSQYFQNGFQYFYFNNSGNQLVGNWSPSYISREQRGVPVGISLVAENQATVPYAYMTQINNVRFGIPNFDLAHDGHLGGGIMGNPVFLLLKAANFQFRPVDGGTTTHRRWAKEVFHTLLCKKLPAVTTTDLSQIPGFYDNNIANVFNLSFRSIASCATCHASQDNLAGVIRHYEPTNITGTPSNTDHNFPIVAAATHWGPWQNLGSRPNNLDPHPQFARFDPTGLLFFRPAKDGVNIVKVPINNLEHAGQVISELDDFFSCQAKKYFKHFTNIDVDLNATIVTGASFNQLETEQRDFVIEVLGPELRAHGIRPMLKKIFESSFFRDRYYRMPP